MKNFIRIMIFAAGLVIAVQSSSFAIADVSVYGGYSFSGTIDVNGATDDFTGVLYGAKAHYNTSLVPLFGIAVGAYYQISKLTLDTFSMDFDCTRTSTGLDVNLLFTPIPLVSPYARLTLAVVDEVEVSGETDTEYFKAWGAGIGAEFTIFPFIRIFGEYMYESTDHDTTYASSSGILGLKFDF